MELEFDVRVNAGVLYDYLLRHTYTGSAGILGSAAGALGVVAFFLKGYPLYLILGLAILIYQPAALYLRARRQALNPVFKEPLHYRMTEEGVFVSQGETQQFQKWEDMYKAVSTGRSLILYTSRVNACIFPRRDLGEKQADVIAAISQHMKPGRVQIRM